MTGIDDLRENHTSTEKEKIFATGKLDLLKRILIKNKIGPEALMTQD